MRTINNWLLSELAHNIWSRKYQFEGESFEQWLDRVSGGDKDLKELIFDKKFLFAGRILSNRGLQNYGVKCTFSNCYVLDQPQDNLESIYETASKLARTFSYGGGVGIDLAKLRPRNAKVNNSAILDQPQDNLESIYETASKLARTFSYGGGVGIDLAKLRPRNAKVNNSAKYTTGAVSFMPTYSEVTGTIGQNNRRGALMLSMPINHPDIEEFIDIKRDLEKVTKANISVRVDADFMKAVKEDTLYNTYFKVEDTGEEIIKPLNAKKLFMRLCENNWDYAEPGILYWDNIESWNILSEYKDFKYAGVNPCAEEPLPAGGSCLLGSLNLSEFVKEPFTEDAYFDWLDFTRAIHLAVKGLNDVLDEGLELHPLQIQRDTVRDWRQIGLGVMGIADMLIKLDISYGSKESIEFCRLELHPLQIQRDTVRDWRQIGLGVMGIADMLIKLDISYGSKESIEFCREVARVLADTSIYASSLLAEEHGSFPKFDLEATLKSPYVQEVCCKETIEAIKTCGLRNSQVLTIAPTGTLSTMLEISGGVEPIFNTSYTRKTESLGDGDQYYKVYTPIIKHYMEAKGLKNEEEIPEHIKVTAMTLDPMQRVDMQSVWQHFIDASISSTVNLPHEATIEDVYNIYMSAHEKGLKGITVFRDGCKRLAILMNDTPKEEEKKEEEVKPVGLARGEKREMAEDTIYHRRPVNIGCGSLHLFIGYSPSENNVQDLYIRKADGGGCEKNIETTVMGIALVLKLGGTLEMIDKEFNAISTCASFTRTRERGLPISKGNCCGNAIMNTIKTFLKEMNGEEVKVATPKKPVAPKVSKRLDIDLGNAKVITEKPRCPECKEEINMIEGCMTCIHCGYSKCS